MRIIGYILLLCGFFWLLGFVGLAVTACDARRASGIDQLPKDASVTYDQARRAIGHTAMLCAKADREVIFPGLMMLAGGLTLAVTPAKRKTEHGPNQASEGIPRKLGNPQG